MEDAVPALIRRSGLTRIADQLVGMLRYALNIKTELVGNEVQLPPGTSKIGGIPDLAPGLAWPKWNKQWLSLIAQIRLADIAPYDHANELPHSGMLYFFLYEDAFNNYLSSPESWRVLYYDGELSDLQPSPIPSDEQQLYPTCTLEFSASLTLPPFESAYIESLGLSFDAFRRDAPPEQRQMADAYIELSKQLGVLNKATDPYHQLLGHPCQVQGDLLWECQQGTHHEEDLTDWCLLLQIDTDDDAGMMWGDCGMLYFYISKRALVKRDFSQVYLTMQCC